MTQQSHSNILAWRIPWTEEPGRLQSRGGHKELNMIKVTQHIHSEVFGLNYHFPLYKHQPKEVVHKYGSHWLHMATQNLKCGQSKLRCTISKKKKKRKENTPYFKKTQYKKRKTFQQFLYLLHTDKIIFQIHWAKYKILYKISFTNFVL